MLLRQLKKFTKTRYMSFSISMIFFIIGGIVREYCSQGSWGDWVNDILPNAIAIIGILLSTIHLLWLYTEEVKKNTADALTSIKEETKQFTERIETLVLKHANRSYIEEYDAVEGIEFMIHRSKKAKYIHNTVLSKPPQSEENRQASILNKWRDNLITGVKEGKFDLTEIYSTKYRDYANKFAEQLGKKGGDYNNYEYKTVSIANDSAQMNFTILFF